MTEFEPIDHIAGRLVLQASARIDLVQPTLRRQVVDESGYLAWQVAIGIVDDVVFQVFATHPTYEDIADVVRGSEGWHGPFSVERIDVARVREPRLPRPLPLRPYG